MARSRSPFCESTLCLCLGKSRKWKGDKENGGWSRRKNRKWNNTKMGDLNPQRTLSELFFVIPERLASIHSFVVCREQTNKQTNTFNYIYRYTTTTQCKLPECKCSICTSGWMKKHHQCKWTICASGCRIKYHQRKL